MKILDPHLKDGVHEWRDGKSFVKEGAKLYLEGTDTLAGRYVPRIACAIHADRRTPQCCLSGHLRPQLLTLHGVFSG
jgi:N-acetylglucosamine-6-phosphate deacetylase